LSKTQVTGRIGRRQLLKGSTAAVAALMLGSAAHSAPRRKPNFFVILCDDLGYGDVGAMGGKTIRTANIDRLAREGTVLTDYYAPANICTPSRAGLLTGRYPIRTGLGWQVIMNGGADTAVCPCRKSPSPRRSSPRATPAPSSASGISATTARRGRRRSTASTHALRATRFGGNPAGIQSQATSFRRAICLPKVYAAEAKYRLPAGLLDAPICS